MQLFPLAQGLPPFDVCDTRASELFQHYRHYYSLSRLPAQHVVGRIDCHGVPLALQAWLQQPGAPVALLVHGYYDHSGWNGPLIAQLLEAGYHVCCLDLPGHGLSGGERASARSFDDYGHAIAQAVHAIATQLAPPALGCGHSTGCAAWLNSLMRHQPLSDMALVLFAPLLRPAHWRWRGRLQFAALRHLVQTYPRDVTPGSSNPVFNRAFAADPLVPRLLTVRWVNAMHHWLNGFAAQPALGNRCLIFQGERDSTVDWRYNLPQLLNKLPAAQLHYLAEAQHQLINESHAIQRHWQTIMVDFLKQQ